jgi:hypothetical protein
MNARLGEAPAPEQALGSAIVRAAEPSPEERRIQRGSAASQTLVDAHDLRSERGQVAYRLCRGMQAKRGQRDGKMAEPATAGAQAQPVLEIERVVQ